jgi:hypothetical protein
MNRIHAIRNLLRAREHLERRVPVSPEIAVDIDLAFIPVPPVISSMLMAGELTRDRTIDWLQRFSGYLLLDMMGMAWNVKKGETLAGKRGDKRMRAYYVGKAFVWNLPGALILCMSNNPFVGHDDVMKGILKGEVNMSLIRKYEALYRKQGYLNPKAKEAVDRELARRRKAA